MKNLALATAALLWSNVGDVHPEVVSPNASKLTHVASTVESTKNDAWYKVVDIVGTLPVRIEQMLEQEELVQKIFDWYGAFSAEQHQQIHQLAEYFHVQDIHSAISFLRTNPELANSIYTLQNSLTEKEHQDLQKWWAVSTLLYGILGLTWMFIWAMILWAALIPLLFTVKGDRTVYKSNQEEKTYNSIAGLTHRNGKRVPEYDSTGVERLDD